MNDSATNSKPSTTDRAALAAAHRQAAKLAYLDRLEMERFTGSGLSRAEYLELLRYERDIGRRTFGRMAESCATRGLLAVDAGFVPT